VLNDDHGFEQARRALKASLERLEMDHIDLYLIRWPVPSQDRYVETWQALIELQAQGLTRAIGVSHFQRGRDGGHRAARRRRAHRPRPRHVRAPPGLTRQRATLMTAFISSGAPSAT